MICDRHQISLGDMITEKKIVSAFSTHGTEDRYIQGLVVTPEGKRKFGRPKLDGKIILKLILKEQIMITFIGFIWLRIGRNCRRS